jgi:hypothetical protein
MVYLFARSLKFVYGYLIINSEKKHTLLVGIIYTFNIPRPAKYRSKMNNIIYLTRKAVIHIKFLVCNARLDDIIRFGIERHYLIGTCFGIFCCRVRLDLIPLGFLQNTVLFCERTHSPYLTVLLNYQSWPNIDMIYIVVQQ